MTDELFDLRNALYVGSFHHVVAEAPVVKCASKKAADLAAFNVERDVLMALAQVGLGQCDAVAGDFAGATHVALTAARLTAIAAREATTSGVASESTIAQIVGVLENATGAGNVGGGGATAIVTALTALAVGGAVSEALRRAATVMAAAEALGLSPRHVLEVHALMVDLYLRWHRIDLAERTWATMRQVDDEHTLTMICGAIVCLKTAHSKSDRLAEAATALQELSSRCGQGTVLLNLSALHKGMEGQWAESERVLLDALSRRSADAVTTTNLAATAAHIQKNPDLQTRYFQQAKALGGAWSREAARLEAFFLQSS